MPEPLLAWAAVAPDGTIKRNVISSDKSMVQGYATYASGNYSWRYAKRAGWRVVQVEIRVKEDGNG